MRKVLIIGAGIGQHHLAQKIKARGDYLLIATLPGTQPCIPLADKVLYVDVYDCEEVLRLAKGEGIDAVTSDQNDMMMPTVAYVAEHLGLPGNTSRVIESYCNKNIFRDNCDKLAIPAPKHRAVNKENWQEGLSVTPYPWMVKPADAQSSIGVAKVRTWEEYETAIMTAMEKSKTHTAIVEEFFMGREVVAEGFIYNGQYYRLGIADREYFALENAFIPSKTIFPSVADTEILGKIEACEKRMATYVKPAFAIVHSEYLYNPQNGDIRVVESALRGGGVYTSSHLIPLYSGIDINEVLLDCAYGRSIDMTAVLSHRQERASAYVCFYLPEGVVTSVSGIETLKAKPWVKLLSLDNLYIGTQTQPMTHKGMRLGPILVDADDRQTIEEHMKEIEEILKIEVITASDNKKGIIWQ